MAGFGKTLKRLKEKERTGFLSLAEEIHKEMLKGTKAPTKEGLLETLSVMKDAVEKPDLDVFMDEFSELYDAVSNTRPRAEGVFHPSSLSADCPRKLWYEVNNVPATDAKEQTHSAKTLMIFDQGTWFHLYIQQKLKNAGVLEKAEVIVESEEWKISGRGDGIVLMPDRRLLEIKTCNSFSYKKALIAPFEQHKEQVCVYGPLLHLTKCQFLYFNKDNSEMVEHTYTFEKEIVDRQFDKMETVLDAKHPLPRVCETATCTEAKGCKWRTHCFSTKL